ncbi:YibE/F family protein [Candidatus Uhrbacteria bacterium]|nr:YibE/F family protein [Candidatus Uhrbacteria bacterium]
MAKPAPRMLAAILLAFFLFPNPVSVRAAGDDAREEEYFRAEVVSVTGAGEDRTGDGPFQTVQEITVRALSGSLRGREVKTEQYFEILPSDDHLAKVGDRVVMLRTAVAGEESYHLTDFYRFPALAWIFAAFFLLAIAVGRWRGFTSILGLLFSVSVIALYVIPGILDGKSPLAVSLIGSFGIALFSIYLSHGLNRRTSIALGSTLLTLGLAAFLSVVFVAMSRVYGLGSEEAFYVQMGMQDVNMKGILLGGIILGALGVLDDVTMAQSSSVEEIHLANPSLPFSELYRRGMSVGKEHIASMVNTLALAYFGASLPLFLLFVMDKTRPFWVIVNGEMIAEEIIRTLVGSSVLICAVPLSTVLAAYVFSRKGKKTVSGSGQG